MPLNLAQRLEIAAHNAAVEVRRAQRATRRGGMRRGRRAAPTPPLTREQFDDALIAAGDPLASFVQRQRKNAP